MQANLERFKKDLESLIKKGVQLELAMERECRGAEFDAAIKKQLGDDAEEALKKLPVFTAQYQAWYSEAIAVVKRVLPDRLADFVRHYEKPKTRKEITWDNYHLEDYLQGLTVTRGWEKTPVVDGRAALPRFKQQQAILASAKARFESSLFEIRQLVQADLFDSEIDAARELYKKNFGRAAGAIAGVVLEKHLAQVCDNHSIKITKKHPTISDLNDLLKKSDVIDVAQWRYNQHLGDLRNLCDHNKDVEPTTEQVVDLVEGTAKITKTLF